MATAIDWKLKLRIKRAPVIPPARGPKKRRGPGIPPADPSCELSGSWFPSAARLNRRAVSQPTATMNDVM